MSVCTVSGGGSVNTEDRRDLESFDAVSFGVIRKVLLITETFCGISPLITFYCFIEACDETSVAP